jgi:hypothetical protein
VDDALERAVERANRRLAEAAEGRADQAAVDAALERAREALQSFAQASAELQEGLPAAIQDGVREHFRPSARHLAEVRGLTNQVLRRLERIEGDLAAERNARVDDLALLVELVTSGWESVNRRLGAIEDALDARRLRSVS